ncbi:metalloprotease [Sarocladium strictum]
MNEDYAPSGIHFDMKGITRTSDDDWGQHEDKLALHKSLRMGGYSTLNIFYIDGFNQNHKNLATATYPKGYDRYSDDFWLDGCTLHIGTLPGGTYIPYNLGRTTTHEVGHWLGLYHTFEGEECEGEGDMVDDTPPQAVAATKGCGRQDSCPVVEGWDDVTNFMDYGNDECMDGFTAGQARRMHVLWEKYRAGR